MDKAKKKRIKKYISWISMALVVALLAAMPLLARQEAEADGPVASVLTAEVTSGSITTTLHGGGTVNPENVEEIKLPSGVKIKEFLVKNGELVKEGTPLALVDKVSVMTAITEVSETMEFLREELEDARDEKVGSSIKATAGGRVKKVFAEAGDSVQDVMLRHGALAVLSLDGMMAVKIEQKLELTTGETVTVTLADGTEVSGRVESNLDGVVIVTIEDEGYEPGQRVTVSLEEVTLGEGDLYIHNAWKATAYSGTIENVSAKEEKTVNDGATLFTLKDRDYEGELRRRAGQHREYEELLQKLFKMYEDGVILAPCDGEVEGVDEDSAHLLSAVPEGWVIAPLSNTVPETGEKGWTVMLLTSGGVIENSGSCTGDDQCTLASTDPADHKDNCIKRCTGARGCNANVHRDGCLYQCTGKYDCPAAASGHAPDCGIHCTKAATLAECPLFQYPGADHHPDCIGKCTHGTTAQPCHGTKNHHLTCLNSCNNGDNKGRVCNATGEHYKTCIKSCTHADQAAGCPAEGDHYADCIRACTSKLDCPASKHNSGSCPHYNLTYTAEVGIVVRVTNGKVEYKYESAAAVPATKVGTGYAVGAKINPMTMVNGPGFVESGGASCKPGDIILIITGKNSSGTAIVDRKVFVYGNVGSASGSYGGMDKDALEAMMKGMGGMGGFDLSSLIGGFSGFGNMSAAAPEEENLFDLEGDTLLTVTPNNTATITISVDEHDIARVKTGMKATVKVEALKGEEFPAEITAVGLTGSNNGGSSKFPVEVTLDMSEDMLAGMSAAVVVPLEEKQDVLLIPAAALAQQGAKTVVFTALDEEGQPSAPVEVVTGVTDGENVEVVSGLTLGQKVHYLYYDTVELNTSAEAEKYTLY